MTGALRLVPYADSSAAAVVAWCAASPFSTEWVPAGATDPLALLAGWHSDPDISGHLLLRADVPVAYGELWVEPGEAELAHLVVDPALRGQGLGQALAVELVAIARLLGVDDVFIRVRPDNEVAIGCYGRVSFAPVSAEDEAEFNTGQPAACHWMRHRP